MSTPWFISMSNSAITGGRVSGMTSEACTASAGVRAMTLFPSESIAAPVSTIK